MQQQALVRNLAQVGRGDGATVGGKSSSLGEMIQHLSKAGVRVPGGFTTTAYAYQDFLKENHLGTQIDMLLGVTDVSDVHALDNNSETIRSWIMAGAFSEAFIAAVNEELGQLFKRGVKSVAVRSSATAEDLADASFAGQQDTLLNVPVELEAVLVSIKRIIASLYTSRAITYRTRKGFEHNKVSICVCVQQMVKSVTAGVMFTVDPDSGHDGFLCVTAVFGLGDRAVGGENTDMYYVGKPVRPGGSSMIVRRVMGSRTEKKVFASQMVDGEYTVTKPVSEAERLQFCLSDSDIDEVTGYGIIIEQHYNCPMDIEWAKDQDTGEVLIVQARPITVLPKKGASEEIYTLRAENPQSIVTGIAIGSMIATGTVCKLKDSSPSELAKVPKGGIIFAGMTDPNFEPAMKLSNGFVTERGSSLCHAAILSRELGKPAVVSCEGVLALVTDGQEVTICCAEGAVGQVYVGKLKYDVEVVDVGDLPELDVKLRVNIGDPRNAPKVAMRPHNGVGLARQEFLINSEIGVHPMACAEFDSQPPDVQKEIRRRMVGYDNAENFYVRKLAEGIAFIARSFWPHKVTLRLSDNKTDEYNGLVGAAKYEPVEANPLLGFRGAVRYTSPLFKEAFRMECEAIRHVFSMGLTNIDLMVPFIRTVQEGRDVIDLLAQYGLNRSQHVRIGMMCEVPSNCILAEEFVKIFDFVSFGTNDLTSMVLGIDRGANYGSGGNENDPAVRKVIAETTAVWRNAGKDIGICGQAPSDYDGYAAWLYDLGFTSISLNPDTIVSVWRKLGEHTNKSVHTRVVH